MKVIKALLVKYFSTLSFFYKYLKFRLLVIFLNSLVVGVLDGIGLALFVPLLQSTEDSNIAGVEMGQLQFIIDGFTNMGIDLTLNVVLLLMMIMFVSKGFIKFWEKYYAAMMRMLFFKRVRYKLVDGLSGMRFSHYVKSDTGKIQNALTTEINRVVSSFNQYFITIQNLILVSVYLFLAFLTNAQFALLAIGAGLATNFVYKFLYTITKRWSSRISSEGNVFQGFLIQSVLYFKYLKATGGMKKYSQKLKQKIDGIEKANLQIGKINALLVGSREAITILIVLLVILIHVNYNSGSIGGIILSLLFLYRAMGNLMNVQNAWNGFLSNSGSLNNLRSFYDELLTSQGKKGEVAIDQPLEKITVNNLSFAYQDKHKILDDISFEIKANETVAIIGESGSGKTTLVNLLVGLLDDFDGAIKYNDLDYRKIKLQSLHEKIGYITQEAVIFDDNIVNNITFWDDLEKGDNLQSFNSAMKKAAIYDYVQTLPSKEESMLGNNGVMLSGGQRQRISIARELYKNISLLVMDEATSALDSETENVIQQNIEDLKGKYTMIIIAHRLSTVKHADKILLLKNGKIDSVGTYDQLLEDSENFRRMVKYQNL